MQSRKTMKFAEITAFIRNALVKDYPSLVTATDTEVRSFVDELDAIEDKIRHPKKSYVFSYDDVSRSYVGDYRDDFSTNMRTFYESISQQVAQRFNEMHVKK